MAERKLLVERVISGKGLVKLDILNDKKYRHYLFYIDVIRKPKNEYVNLGYNPPQSFYANCQFRKAGYVTELRQIRYEAELWEFVPDISGQTLYAVKCAYEGLLQSFINQNIALGLIVLSVVNTIKDYSTIPVLYDELAVTCYSSAAVRFRVYGIRYDICDPDQDKQEPPGEPPPKEPGSIPPDSPITVSEPYDEESDDGDSVPFPGDDTSPFPIGEQCQVLLLTFDVLRADGETDRGIQARVFGELEDLYVQNASNGSAVIAVCRGNVDIPGQQCLSVPEPTGLYGATEEGFYADVTLVSAVPQ